MACLCKTISLFKHLHTKAKENCITQQFWEVVVLFLCCWTTKMLSAPLLSRLSSSFWLPQHNSNAVSSGHHVMPVIVSSRHVSVTQNTEQSFWPCWNPRYQGTFPRPRPIIILILEYRGTLQQGFHMETLYRLSLYKDSIFPWGWQLMLAFDPIATLSIQKSKVILKHQQH